MAYEVKQSTGAKSGIVDPELVKQYAKQVAEKKPFYDVIRNLPIPLVTVGESADLSPEEMAIKEKMTKESDVKRAADTKPKDTLSKAYEKASDVPVDNNPAKTEDAKGFDFMKLLGDTGSAALNLGGKGLEFLGKQDPSTYMKIAAGRAADQGNPYLGQAYSNIADTQEKYTREENLKTKQAMLNPDNQIIQIQDPKTGDINSKLVNKYDGTIIKDLGKAGFAGNDPTKVSIAGQSSYASAQGTALGKSQGEKEIALKAADFDLDTINTTEKELLKANENAYSGKTGLVQAGIEKESQSAFGTKPSQKLENTSMLNNRLRREALSLTSMLTGVISDKDLAILQGIAGSTDDINQVDRATAIREVARIKRDGIKKMQIQAGKPTSGQQTTSKYKVVGVE